MSAVAPRPDQPPPAVVAPVSIAGFFSASSGLGEGARRLADAIEAAGMEVHRVDLTRALRQGDTATPGRAPDGPGTLILHVNGALLPWSMAALGRRAVAGKNIIAFWNWELPVLPDDWLPAFRFVHRVWAPSAFTAEAIRARAAVPVEVVPYPVPEPRIAPLSRPDFGLPADAFITLSIFDASSSVERKNPLAAIRAHRRAFGDRPDRILVLKTYQTGMGGLAWRDIQAAAAEARNVRILDTRMTREQVWALIRCANVFVSLHRAEGVGLTLAEAMRLGVPVLATGWSGNMDFMPAGTGITVGFTKVPATDEAGVYSVPGAYWAEPDVAEASDALRRLAEDPAFAATIAAAGQARAETMSAEASGRTALAALGLRVGEMTSLNRTVPAN